jgi:hypothetical protein
MRKVVRTLPVPTIKENTPSGFPKGPHILVFQFIGFQKLELSVEVKGDEIRNITLVKQGILA